MSTDAIVRLKVTLDDVKPAVMRRLEVPLNLRLDRLHLVLQAAIGWTNSHLWEIRVRDIGWGPPQSGWDLGGDVPLKASKASLLEVIEDTGAKTFKYLYDFGDGWEHTLKIERVGDPAPGLAYPRLIEAQGRCPPEDVGGPRGYAEFLEAIIDPGHERHAELTEWYGATFDPQSIERNALVGLKVLTGEIDTTSSTVGSSSAFSPPWLSSNATSSTSAPWRGSPQRAPAAASAGGRA